MTNQLPAVFIGSSSEGLDIAREVELQLLNVALVNLWTNGIFVLGEGTLESLVNALDNFDFAIMILSPDDLLETRGQNFASPRDNVLFELGLFMGRLGRRRTIILSEEGVDLKLPSDLAGITRATYRKHNNQPRTCLARKMKSEITSGLHLRQAILMAMGAGTWPSGYRVKSLLASLIPEPSMSCTARRAG
jgi:predicted nucleotide-binding protein